MGIKKAPKLATTRRSLVITSMHGDLVKLRRVYARIVEFFNDLKVAAPQLSTDSYRINYARQRFQG